MVYNRVCTLCNSKLRANGAINMHFMINDHLQKNHSQQYQKLSELRYNVVHAKQAVGDYERLLGF